MQLKVDEIRPQRENKLCTYVLMDYLDDLIYNKNIISKSYLHRLHTVLQYCTNGFHGTHSRVICFGGLLNNTCMKEARKVSD
jgi:hypothetical protein